MLSEDQYKELLKFKDDIVEHGEALDEPMKSLKWDGFIEGNEYEPLDSNNEYPWLAPPVPISWRITKSGKDALKEYEAKQLKNYKKRQYHRWDRSVRMWAIIIPFLTAILGFIVGFYTGKDSTPPISDPAVGIITHSPVPTADTDN